MSKIIHSRKLPHPHKPLPSPEPEKKELISNMHQFSDIDIKPFIKSLREAREATPMEEFSKWYQDEYMKQWQFKKMPNISKSKIDSENSSLLRMNNISALKYKYSYNTMDMIVVVMKLYDYETKKETNYGTLFCELLTSIGPVRKALLSKAQIHGNVAFTFYSASSSFISSDGEYRSRFSLFSSLVSTKMEYADIWTELEEYVNRIKIRRQWSPYASYFYPKLEQEERNSEVEFSVKNEMIPLHLLIVSWFHAVYNEMLSITETNINPNFRDIFLKDIDIDLKFMHELVKKFGAERVDDFRNKISHSSKNFKGEDRYMQCGYKMIPLNIKEVQDPLRLRYKPWREYFVANKCNDLVINSVAPGFAIINDWFYIKNSKKGLYDNQSQYDRMKNSELAKDILHILYEAQRGTYFAAEGIKDVIKTNEQIKKDFIAPKFRKLKEKIDDPINFSIEEIIMSEVTLAFVSEYVGRTMSDTVSLVQKSKSYDEMIKHPFKDHGYDYLAKYMFEICYNLFCINSRLGLIHGDFHLNNATIGPLYYPANVEKNSKIVYVIDDNYQFVFPSANGYFASIIDFSRVIINPNMYDELQDKSLPISYQLVKDEEKFKLEEIRTLTSLYTQLFPNKLKQKEELIVIFKNHFDAAFRLLTCLDIYMFSIRLSRMLRQASFTPGKKCLELIDKINKLAEGFLATDMNHLINDSASYSKKVLDDDWPLLTIIKKCFGEYIDGTAYKNIGTIVDVYCYNNELKYSVCKYDLFPDILKYVKHYDEKNKAKLIEIKHITDRRKQNRNERERENLHNLEMVNYIALRHTQKLV